MTTKDPPIKNKSTVIKKVGFRTKDNKTVDIHLAKPIIANNIEESVQGYTECIIKAYNKEVLQNKILKKKNWINSRKKKQFKPKRKRPIYIQHQEEWYE